MFLPEHRYTDKFNDDEWIKEQLARLPAAWQLGARNKYSKIYLESGRQKANLWLLKGCKEHGRQL